MHVLVCTFGFMFVSVSMYISNMYVCIDQYLRMCACMIALSAMSFKNVPLKNFAKFVV